MLQACNVSRSRYIVTRSPRASQTPVPPSVLLPATQQTPSNQEIPQGSHPVTYVENSGASVLDARSPSTGVSHRLHQHEKQQPQQEQEEQVQPLEQQYPRTYGYSPTNGMEPCGYQILDSADLGDPGRGPVPWPAVSTKICTEGERLSQESGDRSLGSDRNHRNLMFPEGPLQTGGGTLIREASCDAPLPRDVLPENEHIADGEALGPAREGPFATADIAHLRMQKTEKPKEPQESSQPGEESTTANPRGGAPMESQDCCTPERSQRSVPPPGWRGPLSPPLDGAEATGNALEGGNPARVAAAEVTGGPGEGPLQQHIAALIRSAMDRFESLALQRMEALMQQTWGPRQKKIESETELAIQVNTKLLQSIHLEGLSTGDLKAVLCLSEELRRHGAYRPVRVGAPSPNPPLHLQAAYTSGATTRQGPLLASRGCSSGRGPRGPADFVVTPRGSVEEAVLVPQQRTQLLDAIDERDGFSDLFRGCGPGGPQNICTREDEEETQKGKRGFGRGTRSSSEVSREAAAAAATDIAVAAAAAAEFMDTSNGRGSPSVFGQRAPRRRARQSQQKRVGASRGPSSPLRPEDPFEWQEEMPVKRCCRSAPSRRLVESETSSEGLRMSPAVHNPEEGTTDSFGLPLAQQVTLGGDTEGAFSHAAGAFPYFVLGGLPDPAGLSMQGTPCLQVPRCARRLGHNGSSRGSTEGDSCGGPSGAPAGEAAVSVGAPSYRGSGGPAADAVFSTFRSPVKGVYYDSFKKLWRVQWHASSSDLGGSAAEGKRMSRSFSCSRLGFDLARARAVAWMLSGGLVGDGGAPASGRRPGAGTLDASRVCTVLASAAGWEAVQDNEIKEFAVFYDPKRFLTRVEGYYVAQKPCGGPLASTHSRPLTISNNTSINNVATTTNSSSNGENEACTGSHSPSPSPDGGRGAAVAKACSGGKRGPRGPPISSRQRVLSPISLDEILEIVWGRPQEAAAYIMATAGGDAPSTVAVSSKEKKAIPERKSTTSTTTSADICFIKPEKAL